MRSFVIMILLMCFVAGGGAQSRAATVGDLVNLPDSFQIKLYAKVPEARTLVVVPELGAVFVGQRKGNTVHAIIDKDMDGEVEAVVRVLRGLKSPNGIAWRDGWLYVAEQHRLVRYPATDLKTLIAAEPEVLYDDLPDDSWHGWRYARFGPDGMLYVSIGAPCNICETTGLEGSIVRFDPEGGAPEIAATGVRNSVGFDFDPVSQRLHFTDNGADGMGDASPPDELNRLDHPNQWFGFPYYGGGSDRTPDFADLALPREATPPVVAFGAHVAALGISFYTGTQFPGAYLHDAFVAQHGSWNRSIPDGYRITRVRFDDERKVVGHEIFADGFLSENGSAWGRPVDVKTFVDGSLLISDDRQGAVYRIWYVGNDDD